MFNVGFIIGIALTCLIVVGFFVIFVVAKLLYENTPEKTSPLDTGEEDAYCELFIHKAAEVPSDIIGGIRRMQNRWKISSGIKNT